MPVDNQLPDLNLLNTLKVLLEERHVTLAAQRLCVSQPAISRRLAQLRELFHDPLLVRTGNALEPTSLAKSLLPRLEGLFDQAGAIVHAGNFDPAVHPLEICLAVTDHDSQTIIPGVLSGLLRLCPGLTLRVRPWQRIRPMELMMGEVHCAVCHVSRQELPESFHTELLAPRNAVCLMRRGHPLAKGKLTLEKYLSCKHVSYLYEPDCPNWLDEALTARGLKRDIAVYYPSVRGAVMMLPGTDLILSTSRKVADAYAQDFGLACMPTPVDMAVVPNCFIWHDRSERDPGHAWFRTQFLRLFRELDQTRP